MLRPSATLVLLLLTILTPLAHADQGSFTNSGGSTSVSSGVAITSSVATPAGSLTLNCPATTPGSCSGGSFTYLSNDGTIGISASFTSGTFAESCSGGGRGGHVTCSYSFTGYLSGTWTVNGAAQAFIGVSSQAFGTGGAAATGTTAYNSAYTPFYYSDSEQILRADDLQGTNQISFGSQGSGVGQFYGAYGIALDASGRIYVADTYNCRIVRIDDMNGTNWISFGGTCGSGQGQFYDPSGIAVDSAGKIYVTDTGNSRIVRMDDMNGTNWIAYGTAGAGVGQFASDLTSVAVDGSERVYIADTGNKRVVRIDDMNGTNWTALTQSAAVNGVSYYSLQSPVAVALDAAGRIYVADSEYYQPAVVRVDDMTGTNWTSIYTGPYGGLNSIAVDSGGTVFTGGGGAKLVINMTAVLSSSGSIGPIGSYYVFGVTPLPLPSPRPSAIGLSPSSLTFTQDVGTSGSQPVTISNFGFNALNLGSISATGGFGETNTCPGQLAPGSNCVVTVTFAPSVSGSASGMLTVTDDSGNLGAAQTVTLTGSGTVAGTPTATATPTEEGQQLPTPTPTPTTPPALIPGRGDNGCALEWFTRPATAVGRTGLPVRRLTCTDDDPLCDFGATTGDNACTFHVALCLNVVDGRLSCVPSDVAQVQLTNPNEAMPKDALATANRNAVESALTALGGSVRGLCANTGPRQGQLCAANADCDSTSGSGDGVCAGRFVAFAPPFGVDNVCTAFAAIQVPLRPTATGFRAGSTTLRVKGSPSAGGKARNSLRLTCEPHA